MWIKKWLPCEACRYIRERQTLRIKWPVEVLLTAEGATFVCHKCGRTGLIARETIPRM
jgi:hypothetical protein